MENKRLVQCPHCGEQTVSAGTVVHSHDGVSYPWREATPPLDPEPIAALQAQVDKLEPWLRKTDWYPMTYMMIPGILRSADLLLLKLEAHEGPDKARAIALHERLTALRTGFHREPCRPPSEARKDD